MKINLIIKEQVKNTLQEIGTATAKSYNYRLIDDMGDEFNYEFITDSKLFYDVLIYVEENQTLDISFYVRENEYQNPDATAVTNKGEMFKVMATITAIIKEVVNKVGDIRYIKFSPTKKSGERTPLDQTQRFRLYMAYIKNVFPNSKVQNVKDRGEDYILIELL